VDLAQGFHLSKPQPALVVLEQFRSAPAQIANPKARVDEFALEFSI
jgi:hypothetical protein